VNKGQWRVLVLLLVLLGMEIIRSDVVQVFFKTIIGRMPFASAVQDTGLVPSANISGSPGIQTAQPDKNTLQCPSGFKAVRASGGNLICIRNTPGNPR